MSSSYRFNYQRPVLGFGRPWTPTVKILILACGGIFLAQVILPELFFKNFSLDTSRPLHLWRYLSYLFLHGGVGHLLFNMFALWIFGSEMEDYFGSRKFLQYYLFCGVGAGLVNTLIDLAVGQPSLVIGASGAIFGLLLAYGIIYAERTITMLLFFVVPLTLKAKHFVIIYGVVEFLWGVSSTSQVAHFAHLGGMAFGYLYLKTGGAVFPSRLFNFFSSFKDRIETMRTANDDRRMDDLLKKVNREGIQSLTDEEKQFLHRMSRRKKWH